MYVLLLLTKMDAARLMGFILSQLVSVYMLTVLCVPLICLVRVFLLI